MQDLKIISKGFEIDSPQTLSIWILIISRPWALLGSRFQIILAISVLLNDIDEINFSALFKNFEGIFIKEHWSAKKELNISTFSLKMVTYLFWWIKVGIQAFFNCSKTSSKSTNRLLNWSLDPGVDSEILKRRDALCQPPQLADEENFRFTMV